MADTLVRVPAQYIDNPDAVFSEPDFRHRILENRDKIIRCECYRDTATDYYKIRIVNDSAPYAVVFPTEALYNTALTDLMGG